MDTSCLRTWSEINAQIEKEIVSASFDVAEVLMEQCLQSRKFRVTLDSEQRIKLSQFARRISRPEKALRILQKVKSDFKNTDPFICEFAQVLAALGAIGESRRHLQKLSQAHRSIDVQILKAYLLVHEWRYEESIPIWKRIMDECSATKEQLSLVRINLAAAFIYTEKYEVGIAMLNKQLGEFQSSSYTLLILKTQVLLIQGYLELGDEAEARSILSEALQSGKKSAYWGSLLKMWSGIIDLRFEPGRTRAVDKLCEFRSECMQNRKWELARRCDFELALASGSADQLLRVYFATSYPSFRARVQKQLVRMNIDLPESLNLIFSSEQKRLLEATNDFARIQMDVLDSGIEVVHPAPKLQTEKLEAGGVLCQLFIALVRDAYQPVRVAELFESIYPGRHYCHQTSPPLVYQAIFALRKWLVDAGVPLMVVEDGGAYQLRTFADEEVSIRVSLYDRSHAYFDDQRRLATRLSVVKRVYQRKSFTSEEAAGCLGLSNRMTQILLKQAYEQAVVKQVTQGRKRIYSFSELSA